MSLKSTRDGVLKNVLDGISRPLGSQQIQKTKVGTVLVDTLYYVFFFIFMACGHTDLLNWHGRTLQTYMNQLKNA